MKLDARQYEKLIADVEKEFTEFFAKSESEAKPAESSDEADDKKDEESEDKKDEEPKAEDKKDAEAPKAEEKKEDEKKDEGSEDSHDYHEGEVDELHKMYQGMQKGELKLHKDCMDKAWMHKCGDMQVVKSEGSPESLKKSEEMTKADQSLSLVKSELESKTKEAEAAIKANIELKKNVEDMALALNEFLTKKGPVRKAITSLEVVKKSEESEKTLTKSEIHAILIKKSADPKTGSGDREAINNYYLRGQNLETVKHLLG